ncbi:hypothetical protein HMN09_00260600 [Mycena chlorophos]|uniref:Biotrophy-associated secreted protein 2 n=1 Tax=Mycena chlorophos TaxID=658473 RepID=A0A8H6WIW1_MYCCL|nr:hypothetical protein HMN09_00260600 [Mycena chlorophos]
MKDGLCNDTRAPRSKAVSAPRRAEHVARAAHRMTRWQQNQGSVLSNRSGPELFGLLPSFSLSLNSERRSFFPLLPLLFLSSRQHTHTIMVSSSILRVAFAVNLALAFSGVNAIIPRQANGGPAFDPSGAKNVGNGAGLQFIGGQCLSAADCGSGCCAGPSGICSGVGAQTQAGKTGCGFVSGGAGAAPAAAATTAVAPAAAAPAAAASTGLPPNVGGPPFDPAGVPNVGNGAGKQFIGGQCLSAADCNSGCCAGPSGICSGVGAQTQAGKTGCGFVSGSSSSAPAAPACCPPAAAAPAAVSTGTQFITGACTSDTDCASGCCGATSGKCAARAVAEGPGGGGGCGFGQANAGQPGARR